MPLRLGTGVWDTRREPPGDQAQEVTALGVSGLRWWRAQEAGEQGLRRKGCPAFLSADVAGTLNAGKRSEGTEVKAGG